MKRFLYIVLFIFAFNAVYAQNINQDLLKANWIFIIADNVNFPNEDQIDTFKIAIYGKNSNVYNFAKNLENDKTIKGKPVRVYNVNKLSDLVGYNIVYLDETKNDFIEPIYVKIKDQHSLLITYRNDDQDHIMINLLLQDKTNQFQIQSSNLYDAKIVASEKLLSLGGNKIDLQGLYEKKVKELQKKQALLEQQEKVLKKREQELDSMKRELDKQVAENLEKSKQIEQQRLELERQKQNAQKLLEQVEQQKQILKQSQYILNNLNTEIKQKQELIKQQNQELENKKLEVQKKQDELAKQQELIDKKNKILEQKTIQIQTQQGIIAITVVFVIIFLILSIIIWRALAKNKKITRELRSKNEEIERQKDELKKQALQLEEFNKELQKLSLVASKTDNSVIIMSPEGVFEWVNPGFTRIYGYTLQLLTQEKGNSIIEISENKEEKRKLVEECIKKKKTVVYQALNTTRDGKKIWVQTALTPVLDENDNVVKLIAIESDITKLKQQELEIKQKNEVLEAQKAELQSQKEILEEVNKQIRDSIRYALTIQNATLPQVQKISEYFENFLVFIPRDIVSGDFYWFSQPKTNITYIATVDCTGHGVPGAFMSLISTRMLEEVVFHLNIEKPADILTELNKMIFKSLNQKDTNNRDGMDMVLVRLEKNQNDNTYKVEFAGAKRPLFYYKQGDTEISEIKGNRRSIGGISFKPDYVFEQQTIILKKDDILYLSTDGYIDQNDKSRKRFGTIRFIALLNKIKNLPMDKQKIEMIRTLEDYKGEEAQRDDITIWGIKL